jgi:hypothetical protein
VGLGAANEGPGATGQGARPTGRGRRARRAGGVDVANRARALPVLVDAHALHAARGAWPLRTLRS